MTRSGRRPDARRPRPGAWASRLALLSCTFAAILCACGAAGKGPKGSGHAASLPPEGFWARWGDGRAEVAAYSLVQPRYGEIRTGYAVLIFVTETFSEAQGVKSDGGHDDEFPVLKLNEGRRFQTGIYDYSILTSTFAPLDGRLPWGQPAKVSLSVQEWCGHVWDMIRIEGPRLRRDFHSYFDGEADQQHALTVPDGAVVADTLPMIVRGLLGTPIAPGERREVPYLSRLHDGRFRHTKEFSFGRAIIERSPSAVVRPDGARAWIWTITEPDGRTLRYEVEDSADATLLQWEASDGERGTLLGHERVEYWRLNKEGDEAVLARLGLPVPKAAAATGLDAPTSP